MGTKVMIENYLPGQYSMRDLSRESNGAGWPSPYNDVKLANDQFYYGSLPKTIAESYTGYNKGVVRQTMLEHEAMFKDQVYELHRLYRVQRDLTDEVRKKGKLKYSIPNETSSSSTPLPSQMQSENAQRCNGSSFPFGSPSFGRPLISYPDNASPSFPKAKTIQATPNPFQNCHSPKNSQVSESRPSKFRRRMLDLQLPADEYVDTDDEKDLIHISSSPDENSKPSFGMTRMFPTYPHKTFQGDATGSSLLSSISKGLTDLNEPLHGELSRFSSVDLLGCNDSHWDSKVFPLSTSSRQNSKIGNLNGTVNNLQDTRENGLHYFCSALESEQYKASVKFINHGLTPEKAPLHALLNGARQSSTFLTVDQIHVKPWSSSAGITAISDLNYSMLNNDIAKPIMASHSSRQQGLFRPSDLGHSWDQCATSFGNPNSLGSTTTSLQPSPVLSAKSSVMFDNPGANVTFGCEPPVRNRFYPRKEMNLNMIPPNGLSNDYSNPQGLKITDRVCKTEDPLDALPWLRKKGPSFCVIKTKANKSECSQNVLGVSIFGNPPIPNEINCTADISGRTGKEDTECRERKCFFDMNIPCEGSDSEQEIKVSEKKQTKSFDLNSCITEEETPSGTSPLYNYPTVKFGTGIDLEALINLENEDLNLTVADPSITGPEVRPENRADDWDAELAESAVSAIVAMSCCVNPIHVPIGEEGDDPLHWFVSVACSMGNNVDNVEMVQDDGLPEGLEDFEYTILRQKESTPGEYFPKPSIPDFPIIENSVGDCSLTKARTRGRRGKQKRDFQRDILPGLTTLSRLEVTEDLQTLGGPSGFTKTRNGRGRGRRRVVAETTPIVVNGICALPPLKLEENNKNLEAGFEDRSLRGWGKTTRRPRRQRCTQGNPDLLVNLT